MTFMLSSLSSQQKPARTLRRAFRGAARLFLALPLLLAACVPSAEDAPWPPRFEMDADELHTHLPRITLKGVAKAGSSVKLSRRPAFTDAQVPLPQTANPFSSKFEFANVHLLPGSNVFELVAVDDQGQESPPAQLTVHYEPDAPGLQLSVDSSILVAGPGSGRGFLRAKARFDVSSEAEASVFADRELLFELQSSHAQSRTALSNERGEAEVEFADLNQAGPARLKVSYEDLSASVDLEVLPGPIFQVEVEAFAVDVGAGGSEGASSSKSTSSGSTADLVVQAGSSIEVQTRALDAAGNLVPASLNLNSDLIVKEFDGQTFYGLNTAGDYSIYAWAEDALGEPGGRLSAELKVQVLPGPAHQLIIDAPSHAEAGKPVRVRARVADVFGNLVPHQKSSLNIGSDDPQSSFERETQGLPSEPEPALADESSWLAMLRSAGVVTLKLSEASGLEGVHSLEVLPASVSELQLQILDSPALLALKPRARMVANPSAELQVELQARDEFGNLVNSKFSLSSSHPEVQVEHLEGMRASLRGLKQAGEHELRAWLHSPSLHSETSLLILPAAAKSVGLQLSSSQAQAGESVGLQAWLEDGFGNVRDDELELGVKLANGVPLNEAEFELDSGSLQIFQAESQPFTVYAQAANDSTLEAARELSISPGPARQLELSVSAQSAIRAGDEPEVTILVKDLYGNPIQDPEVDVQVLEHSSPQPPSGPIPFFENGVLKELRRSGQYTVEARIATDAGKGFEADSQSITVLPAAPVEVELLASAAQTLVEMPVYLWAELRDTFGNVHEKNGSTLPQPFDDGIFEFRMKKAGSTEAKVALPSATFVPDEAGIYDLKVEFHYDNGTKSLQSQTLKLQAEDSAYPQAPRIHFSSPAGHEVISSWPPPDSPPGGSEKDVVRAALRDNIGVLGTTLHFAGLSTQTSQIEQWPWSKKLEVSADIDPSQLSSTERGELLLKLSANNAAGHRSSASASWCIDPTQHLLSPSHPPHSRCVITRSNADFSGARAMAMDPAGNRLLLGIDHGIAAGLHLFDREGHYAPIADHILSDYRSPASLALTGNLTFVSLISADDPHDSEVLRVVGMGDTEEVFSHPIIRGNSSTHRLSGLKVDKRYLYALWSPSSAEALLGSRVYRVDLINEKPMNIGPDAPLFAIIPGVSLRHFCEASGARLLAAGENSGGFPVVVSIGGGGVQTLWESTEKGEVFGCAIQHDSVLLSLTLPGPDSVPAVHLLELDLSSEPIQTSLILDSLGPDIHSQKAVGPVSSSGLFFSILEDGDSKGSLLRVGTPPLP